MQNPEYAVHRIGENPNRLWILVCTHGNETLGYRVMENVRTSVDNVTFVLMNRRAYEANARCVDFDLNRCFLWNDRGTGENSHEYRLSHRLHEELKDLEAIVDLHSTDFDIAPYFIVDDLKKAELDSVICVNNELIQYVYLMPFSRGTVIGAYENAVAIECGNNDDESRIAQVSDIVRHISDHISRVIRHPKTVLKFQGELLSDEVETLSDDIRDFEPISVGTLIGTNQTGELVFAKESMRLFWVRNTFENPNIRAIRITST